MAYTTLAFISTKGELSTYDSRGDENRTPEEIAERRREHKQRLREEVAQGKFDPLFRQGELTSIMLDLPSDRKYHLSIDQSSSCTGIYITDEAFSFHFICDIKRGSESKDMFYRYLQAFLRRLLKDCKVTMVVYEDLPPMKYRGSGNVLRELRGHLNAWFSNDPQFSELQEDDRKTILPQQWKSKIIDKSKGTGRFNDKREIASDIVDRFPELKFYFDRCLVKDYDGFDACGIYHGYKLLHYTGVQSQGREGGQRELIAGSKSYYGSVIVFYRTLSPEEYSDKRTLIGPFIAEFRNRQFKTLAWNSENSALDNYRIAASLSPYSVTVIEDLHTNLALRWQFDLGFNDKKIFSYIIRKKELSKSHLAYLKEHLPYEEL